MVSTDLINEMKSEILEGIKHLEYSYKKVDKLTTNIDTLSSEDLETWEGLVARFARVSDIYLSRYIRAKVLHDDPGFRGTFRDFLNQAEKMNLIKDVKMWLEIRELRNTSVHEYSKKKIPLILQQVKDLSPVLIALKGQI